MRQRLLIEFTPSQCHGHVVFCSRQFIPIKAAALIDAARGSGPGPYKRRTINRTSTPCAYHVRGTYSSSIWKIHGMVAPVLLLIHSTSFCDPPPTSYKPQILSAYICPGPSNLQTRGYHYGFLGSPLFAIVSRCHLYGSRSTAGYSVEASSMRCK